MSEFTDPLLYLKTSLHHMLAVEKECLPFLDRQVDLYMSCPELAKKVFLHARQSARQIEKVQACLGQLDENARSSAPAWQGQDHAVAHLLKSAQVPLQLVENPMRQYVIEHYEIAQYKMIVEAAQSAGCFDVAFACEEILCEEQEMAYWIEYHIGEYVEDMFQGAQAEGNYATAGSYGAPPGKP